MPESTDVGRVEPRPIAARIVSLVLTVTAVLGVVSIVSSVAAVAFDVKPLIFRSGSMAPSIDAGALAVARAVPASKVDVGDVVSVFGPDGTRITHRVQTVSPRGDGASLTLRGDANVQPDAQPYTVSSVDRVLFDIPRLGYAVSWISGRNGVLAGGGVVAFALLVVVLSGSTTTRVGGARHATSSSADDVDQQVA